jgi:hypothetical protein
MRQRGQLPAFVGWRQPLATPILSWTLTIPATQMVVTPCTWAGLTQVHFRGRGSVLAPPQAPR